MGRVPVQFVRESASIRLLGATRLLAWRLLLVRRTCACCGLVQLVWTRVSLLWTILSRCLGSLRTRTRLWTVLRTLWHLLETPLRLSLARCVSCTLMTLPVRVVDSWQLLGLRLSLVGRLLGCEVVVLVVVSSAVISFGLYVCVVRCLCVTLGAFEEWTSVTILLRPVRVMARFLSMRVCLCVPCSLNIACCAIIL